MIDDLLDYPIPLPENLSSKRANCFNAVMFYHKGTTSLEFCGPEEFIGFIQENFDQRNKDKKVKESVGIIWSRNNQNPQFREVKISALQKEVPGYPFGLVIEHAFVILNENMVFQKRDPSELGPYEIIQFNDAIKPYLDLNGYEVTFHKKVQ